MQDNDRVISDFDRKVGSFEGLPDAIHTKPATIRITKPVVGSPETWVVSTVRHPNKHGRNGDTIFLELLDAERHFRVCLPPEVSAAIHRQAESLTTRSRSKASKAIAEARKERGEPLPFLKKKVKA